MNPTVGVTPQNIDFSCLDKYAGFFRGDRLRNAPHIGQAAADAFQLWKQRNYDEFRRSLEAQFVNVDLDTANQRYRELVRRHDSVERSRINRFISSDSKCVGKEMGCRRNLLFDAVGRTDPYVGDFMQDILALTFAQFELAVLDFFRLKLTNYCDNYRYLAELFYRKFFYHQF